MSSRRQHGNSMKSCRGSRRRLPNKHRINPNSHWAFPSQNRNARKVIQGLKRKNLFLLAVLIVLGVTAKDYPQDASSAVTFTDVTKQAGITWMHDNAISPERYLPETVGAGCVFFDYDNDGWMDVYLVNSGPSDFFNPAKPLKNALYHNNHDGTFTDVTDKAGVAGGTFGMGIIAS